MKWKDLICNGLSRPKSKTDVLLLANKGRIKLEKIFVTSNLKDTKSVESFINTSYSFNLECKDKIIIEPYPIPMIMPVMQILETIPKPEDLIYEKIPFSDSFKTFLGKRFLKLLDNSLDLSISQIKRNSVLDNNVIYLERENNIMRVELEIAVYASNVSKPLIFCWKSAISDEVVLPSAEIEDENSIEFWIESFPVEEIKKVIKEHNSISETSSYKSYDFEVSFIGLDSLLDIEILLKEKSKSELNLACNYISEFMKEDELLKLIDFTVGEIDERKIVCKMDIKTRGIEILDVFFYRLNKLNTISNIIVNAQKK